MPPCALSSAFSASACLTDFVFLFVLFLCAFCVLAASADAAVSAVSAAVFGAGLTMPSEPEKGEAGRSRSVRIVYEVALPEGSEVAADSVAWIEAQVSGTVFS